MDLSLYWELFHFAILAALLAGVVCPLMGAFLLVRRTGFYGVTLPQFAACGVACGYAVLPWWLANVGLGGLDLEAALESPHALRNYVLAWGALFTFGGLLGLVLLGARKETETGRVAAAFAIAAAVTVLLAQKAPTGREFIEQLLRGEILTVDSHEFETIAAVYAVVLVLLWLFHRDLLLVSFDREFALVLGKRVKAFEALLMILTGLTVSAGVLIVGPIVLFGLLVIPPLAARGLARSMVSFFVLSAAFGVVAAAGGLVASFALDWPLGPSLCAVAALELVPGWAFGRLRHGWST